LAPRRLHEAFRLLPLKFSFSVSRLDEHDFESLNVLIFFSSVSLSVLYRVKMLTVFDSLRP
jgi:hypothetical protein